MLLLGLSAAGATEEKDHVSLRFDAGAAVWVCRVRSWLSWLSGALWAESMLYAVIQRSCTRREARQTADVGGHGEDGHVTQPDCKHDHGC